MNIALTFNENYWALAFATIRSVCISTAQRKNVWFHLCHPDFSAEHMAFFDRITEEFGARISHYNPLNVPKFVESIARLPNRRRFPSIIYARLFLDKLLPPEVERVMYLDCDILVRRPIEDFYDTELGDKDLAAVTDPFHDYIKRGRDMRTKPTPFDTSDPYFNAGAWVIDRSALARADVPNAITDLEKRGMLEKLYYDQDLMNYIFLGRWKELDWQFNLVNPRPEHETQGPRLVHYTTRKPWLLFSGGAFSRVYRHTMTNQVFYLFMRERWRSKFWLWPLIPFIDLYDPTPRQRK